MALRRHAARLAEVSATLVRHGWHPALHFLGLDRFMRRKPSDEGDVAALPPGTLREVLSELGPTYVKVGQLLSTRRDLIPPAYVAELEKLQDAGDPIPQAALMETLAEEIGDVGAVFEHFDYTPLAAASLGQVHAARLAGHGDVIVKVQRPEAHDTIVTDIQILFRLARAFEAASAMAREIGVVRIVEDLAEQLRSELDYGHEGRNADRIRHNLGPDARVRVPEIHWDCTTRRVLVMERFTGCKITQVDRLVAWGLDPKDVARRFALALLRQIFLDGLFHADPHPGNVVVFEDGDIGLLDFGIVIHIDRVTRDRLLDLIVAIHRGDGDRFADSLLLLCRNADRMRRRNEFVQDAEGVLRHYLAVPPADGRVGVTLRDAMSLVLQYRLSMPSEVAALVRAVVAFEGTCKRLDPEFEILDVASGLILEKARQRLGRRELVAAAALSGADAIDLILSGPRLVTDLLSRAAYGRLKLNLEHWGVTEFTEKLDKIANRLSYALVVSACIVGSSILVQANFGPTVGAGWPMIGLVGFGISSILGFGLLWNIIRSGRLR